MTYGMNSCDARYQFVDSEETFNGYVFEVIKTPDKYRDIMHRECRVYKNGVEIARYKTKTEAKQALNKA